MVAKVFADGTAAMAGRGGGKSRGQRRILQEAAYTSLLRIVCAPKQIDAARAAVEGDASGGDSSASSTADGGGEGSAMAEGGDESNHKPSGDTMGGRDPEGYIRYDMYPL